MTPVEHWPCSCRFCRCLRILMDTILAVGLLALIGLSGWVMLMLAVWLFDVATT